jgi:anaphase-promoting complex subunit 10
MTSVLMPLLLLLLFYILFLKVSVLSMHQNGRDTHLRQVKVFGPRVSPAVMGAVRMDSFKTVDMLQFALIR